MNFHPNKNTPRTTQIFRPSSLYARPDTRGDRKDFGWRVFPLILRLVFRKVRIAATAPVTFVMSVRLSTGMSAVPTNFRELHIQDINFIAARDINRP